MSHYLLTADGELIDAVEPSSLAAQEDWEGLKLALLSSSFRAWINQDPAIAALIAAAITTGDFVAARAYYAMLAAVNPPTPSQLQIWQGIADQYGIISIRFVP